VGLLAAKIGEKQINNQTLSERYITYILPIYWDRKGKIRK